MHLKDLKQKSPAELVAMAEEMGVKVVYLDGYSYEVVAERLECDTKTVDNALQRVKRKVGAHLASRQVLL